MKIHAKAYSRQNYRSLKNNQTVTYKLKRGINSIANRGVTKFKLATPVRTGKTADSWDVDIVENQNGIEIIYSNSNLTKDGDPVALLLDRGHGTGTRGYVRPRHFIDSVIRDIISDISSEIVRSIQE